MTEGTQRKNTAIVNGGHVAGTIEWERAWSVVRQFPQLAAGFEVETTQELLLIRHSVEQKDLSFVHCRAGKALTYFDTPKFAWPFGRPTPRKPVFKRNS